MQLHVPHHDPEQRQQQSGISRVAAAVWQLASEAAQRGHCSLAHLVRDLNGPQQKDGGGHDAGNEQATAQGGGHCQSQVNMAACKAPEKPMSPCLCLQFTTILAARRAQRMFPSKGGHRHSLKALPWAPGSRCSNAALGSLVRGEHTSVGLLIGCYPLAQPSLRD